MVIVVALSTAVELYNPMTHLSRGDVKGLFEKVIIIRPWIVQEEKYFVDLTKRIVVSTTNHSCYIWHN